MTRIKRNLGKAPNLAKKVYVNVYVRGPGKISRNFCGPGAVLQLPKRQLDTGARA